MNNIPPLIFSMYFWLVCSLTNVTSLMLLVNNLIIELFEIWLCFFGDHRSFLVFIIDNGIVDEIFGSVFDRLDLLDVVL